MSFSRPVGLKEQKKVAGIIILPSDRDVDGIIKQLIMILKRENARQQ